MHRQLLAKRIALVGICLLLPLLVVVVWNWINRPVVDCNSVPSVDNRIIRAEKVVAQPWLGQHHVYGIFIIPEVYGDSKKYYATMSIRGLSGPFAVGQGGERLFGSKIVIPPGYYPKKVYVPTRTALKALVIGGFRDLKNSCNWTLQFIERAASNSKSR